MTVRGTAGTVDGSRYRREGPGRVIRDTSIGVARGSGESSIVDGDVVAGVVGQWVGRSDRHHVVRDGDLVSGNIEGFDGGIVTRLLEDDVACLGGDILVEGGDEGG